MISSTYVLSSYASDCNTTESLERILVEIESIDFCTGRTNFTVEDNFIIDIVDKLGWQLFSWQLNIQFGIFLCGFEIFDESFLLLSTYIFQTVGEFGFEIFWCEILGNDVQNSDVCEFFVFLFTESLIFHCDGG